VSIAPARALDRRPTLNGLEYGPSGVVSALQIRTSWHTNNINIQQPATLTVLR
jgi:hypothetical protein